MPELVARPISQVRKKSDAGILCIAFDDGGSCICVQPCCDIERYMGQSDDVDIGYLPLLYHSNIVAY